MAAPVMAEAPPPAPAEEPPMKQRRAMLREQVQDRGLLDLIGGEQDEDKELPADEAFGGLAPAGALARRERRGPLPFAPVRVFPAPDYSGAHTGPRTDFRETIHWAPDVRTDRSGKATITFYLSDAVTSFRVFAEGVGEGAAGRAEKVIRSKLPFSMNVKLPLAVSAGDVMQLPLTLTNEQDSALPVSLSASFGDLLTLQRPVVLASPSLAPRRRESLFYDVKVTGQRGESEVKFSANAGGLTDEFVRKVRVEPLGFPMAESAAGRLAQRSVASFDLGAALSGTVEAKLMVYPSPVSTLVSGLQGLLREPSGCFEQTSSSNYPNVMVLAYLQAHDEADPALVQRTAAMLDRGYKKLVGFETAEKGYEWFGGAPGHEALTAYGLLEFADMRAVYGGVDADMMDRTVRWLKGRKDGKGGFARNDRALDSFGRASPVVTNAYVVYSLAQAGLTSGFEAELAVQAALAQETKDPYLLALAAGTFLAVPARRALGASAAARLAAMQGKEGHWPGADHSITRSGGVNLDLETTSLAVLALLQAGGHDDAVRRAVGWLSERRSGFGNWGATQATVLALKAMTAYANAYRRTPAPGRVRVMVNGQPAAEARYEAGRREPLEIAGLGAAFAAGSNTVELLHEGAGELPWSLAVEYRTLKPASHPEVVIDLTTKLQRQQVKMGETVRLDVRLVNKTVAGQPMTLARVGLPGGLTFQTWQLKELREKGLIAFSETRAREVILYFRDLKPSEVNDVPLDLVATVPGTYTGPASSAYLYYTNDRKAWVDGTRVTVTR